MRYMHSVQISLISLVIFIVVAIFVPGIGPDEEVSRILTLATFLFAILSGFFLSKLNARYDKIRDLSASEDAYWVSVYSISKGLGKSFSNNISKVIDDYYIALTDFGLLNYYKKSAKYLDKAYEYFVKKRGTKGKTFALTRGISFLSKIENSRNRISVISLERLTLGQWSVLVLLAGIIIFSVYYLKINTLYSQVTTVLLSTILILVLFIMRDLQNLKLFGNPLLSESEQEVFEAIGKTRYYSKESIDDGLVRIPEEVKKYRLGLHKPGYKPRFKVIKRS